MLQDVMSSMPEDEAKYHLKRCIDSGLWVPDAKKAEREKAEQEKAEQGNQEDATGGKESSGEYAEVAGASS